MNNGNNTITLNIYMNRISETICFSHTNAKPIYPNIWARFIWLEALSGQWGTAHAGRFGHYVTAITAITAITPNVPGMAGIQAISRDIPGWHPKHIFACDGSKGLCSPECFRGSGVHAPNGLDAVLPQ